MASTVPGLRFGEAFPAVLDGGRAGAPWAWDALYAWLAPVVAGYLRVQGAPEPDDLACEVFIGVVKGFATFAGDEPAFRAWAFVIAHRRLQDERRRIRRKPDPAALVDTFAGGDVEDDAVELLARARVQALCGGLAPDQRDVLLLRIVADLTVEQVASIVGKTAEAVKALQRRGFEALRSMMAGEGVPL
ncbi:MAG: sigma-70 family RNA polymerase sigma factor [Acidimicrobiia bacterium]